MKQLKTYLEELFATPMNTTGIGDVCCSDVDNSALGSGDLVATISSPIKLTLKDKISQKKKKKFKRYKV